MIDGKKYLRAFRINLLTNDFFIVSKLTFKMKHFPPNIVYVPNKNNLLCKLYNIILGILIVETII